MAVTSSKRVGRNSFSMRRTNDWVMSTDVPTDITVEVCGASFALHKFPLVSRSGKIRKLVSNARDSELSWIEFNDMPGGSEAFELAAKFCYGINFEITASNVAMLRCAAEYLEMTEDYGRANLVARSEAFLDDVVIHSFGSAITVLHACEKLLPMAEQLNIVNRCVQGAGSNACQQVLSLGGDGKLGWWAEELSILGLDFYQRVLGVMRSQGMPHDKLWGSLMHYAHQTLKGLDQVGQDQGRLVEGAKHPGLEHEQRVLVETIVGLLPPDRKDASCSFLFGLLRTAVVLDTTLACRLELEKRIGSQLDEATLDDLLIPSFSSYSADTLFDTDLVQRLLANFLEHHRHSNSKPSQTALMKVAKLVDTYLAEVAPDANLKMSKFISLAETLPDYARTVDDGLYRAVDIFLKAHPLLGDVDRKKICKVMNPQRLSVEACSHAAQNERLPVHFVIQVLYFEQLRLRAAITRCAVEMQQHTDNGTNNNIIKDNITASGVSQQTETKQTALRRENRELRLELTKMRLRLSDLEKDQVVVSQELDQDKSGSLSPSSSSSKFLNAVSKKLGRLNPFGRSSLGKPPPTPELPRKPRDRRHSIS